AIVFLRFLMQKTRKSIAKRFKKTASGQLVRRTPGHRHLLRKKSVKQRRRARHAQYVAPAQRADLVRAMPFS
ncbi:MAG: 50S ribosomal protein L35, partial [Opitutales bacterium]